MLKYDSAPVLSRDYIKYSGAYYVIGEGRKEFVTENLKDFAGVTLLADIGNGTMNLMYLNHGRPMESKAWTEKLGVF